MNNLEDTINENTFELGERIRDTQHIDFGLDQISSDLDAVNISLAEKAWQEGSRWR